MRVLIYYSYPYEVRGGYIRYSIWLYDSGYSSGGFGYCINGGGELKDSIIFRNEAE